MDKEKRKKISKVGKIIVCFIFTVLIVLYSINSCFNISASQAIVLGDSWVAPQTAGISILNRAKENSYPNAFYYSIPQKSFYPTDIGYFPYGQFVSSTNWESASGLYSINSYQYFSETIDIDFDEYIPGNLHFGTQRQNSVITAYDIGYNGTEQIVGIEYGNFYFFNNAFYEDFADDSPIIDSPQLENGGFPTEYVHELIIDIPRKQYYNTNNEFEYLPSGTERYHTTLQQQTGTIMLLRHIGISEHAIISSSAGVDTVGGRTIKSEISVKLVGTNYSTTILIDDFEFLESEYVNNEGEIVNMWYAEYIDLRNIENKLKEWACQTLKFPLADYDTRPVVYYIESIRFFSDIEVDSSAYIGTDPGSCHIMTQTINDYNDLLMEKINNFDNTPNIVEQPGGNDNMIGNMDISSTVALTSWLGNAISGFFDTTIVAGMTIGGIFILVISFALVMWFLKIFAGG